MARTIGPKFNPYEKVTNQIVAALEAGTVPWRKPWKAAAPGKAGRYGRGVLPSSLSTNRAYRGVNVFLLQLEAMTKGYSSPWWGTYEQIAERGGQVRKGEKSTTVVFWKRIKVTDKDTGELKPIMFLKTFGVFNVEQSDQAVKIPSTRVLKAVADVPEVAPLDVCEQAVKGYLENGPNLILGGSEAFYQPGFDSVTVPALATFKTPEHYYSTLFHELTHSTGHADRLARPGVANLPAGHRFGDELYSKEELVAEMGAAMVSAMTGIEQVTIDNSAAYIASWLKVLKNDAKLVVQAAAQAQRAADLILGVSWAEADKPVETPVAA